MVDFAAQWSGRLRLSMNNLPGAAAGESAHPFLFLLLNLPFGITNGYIIVVVPFLATRAGLPVLTAASIISIALTPKAWKMIWSPLVDMGLTLKSWYAIGASTAGAALVLQSFLPLTHSTVAVVTAALFLSELGSSFLSPAIGGLMADSMPNELKGRAAGWYQLGGKVGRGIGGGGGLWLALHSRSTATAGLSLGAMCLVCTAGLLFLRESKRHLSATAIQRIAEVGRELWSLARSRNGRLVMALSISPIGVSGVDSFWSGIAHEWEVSAGSVVLVTGFASAAAASLGCLIAGWWADQKDRRLVFLATGTILAVTSAAIGVLPRTPGVFIYGSLIHRMIVGMCDVAVSALILSVIGRSKGAATKFAVLGGITNASEVYTTFASGWTHDRWSTATMFFIESGVSLISIVAAAWFLRRSKLVETNSQVQVEAID